MLNKIGLYILSLFLLFFFVIIVSFKLPTDFTDSCSLVSDNYLSLICVVFLIVGFVVFLKFKYELQASPEIPFQITKIESIQYEHLTFLATYIIPLICFDLNNPRYLIVLFILLIAMAIIYIKTDLFYANPSLALLGYQIYKVNGQFKMGEKENLILISREELSVNQRVSYIKLDSRIFYVKRVKHD